MLLLPGYLKAQVLGSAKTSKARAVAPWCLVGNGGMDSYDSPLRVPYSSSLRVPYSSPYNPFPHSLLSTREF